MSTEQEKDRIAVRELGKELVNVSLDSGDHGIALQALLLAYVSIAAAHTCCTGTAANAAEAAVLRLRSTNPSAPLAAANLH